MATDRGSAARISVEMNVGADRFKGEGDFTDVAHAIEKWGTLLQTAREPDAGPLKAAADALKRQNDGLQGTVVDQTPQPSTEGNT